MLTKDFELNSGIQFVPDVSQLKDREITLQMKLALLVLSPVTSYVLPSESSDLLTLEAIVNNKAVLSTKRSLIFSPFFFYTYSIARLRDHQQPHPPTEPMVFVHSQGSGCVDLGQFPLYHFSGPALLQIHS